MSHGYLSLVLHAHLPFVRHPEYPSFLEEDWLFEAISETYIPLIFMMQQLRNEGVPFQISMSVTPPLAEMLSDPLLQERYVRHASRLVELTEKEVEKNRSHPLLHRSAQMYRTHFTLARDLFADAWGGNLLRPLRDLQDSGHLEILTCGATHGFLPLMSRPECVNAQIQVAKNNYIRHFGREPRGIWLPECGFTDGVEEHLKNAGLKYFILDTHALLYGQPRPRFGVFSPVFCANGIAAFARDMETSQEVWSSTSGYPGDFNYREFYRDLGYDGDYEYIRRYLHSDGVRRNLGIKYHRVTGRVALGDREFYDPDRAEQAARSHAQDFVAKRVLQLEGLRSWLGRPPIIVSPYDAELFGHWWFEGPTFLKHVLLEVHKRGDELKTITPTGFLRQFPINQMIAPENCSWGAGGYNYVWLNEFNSWIYRHQHVAEARMIELADYFGMPSPEQRRMLNQAARELLLAQSSDWAFIMTHGTTVPYAEKRFRDHIHRFTRLYEMLQRQECDQEWLQTLEERDTIFPEMDYRVYRSQSQPPRPE